MNTNSTRNTECRQAEAEMVVGSDLHTKAGRTRAQETDKMNLHSANWQWREIHDLCSFPSLSCRVEMETGRQTGSTANSQTPPPRSNFQREFTRFTQYSVAVESERKVKFCVPNHEQLSRLNYLDSPVAFFVSAVNLPLWSFHFGKGPVLRVTAHMRHSSQIRYTCRSVTDSEHHCPHSYQSPCLA
jgi:hypothetical protein